MYLFIFESFVIITNIVIVISVQYRDISNGVSGTKRERRHFVAKQNVVFYRWDRKIYLEGAQAAAARPDSTGAHALFS